jgi:Viral BACON domain/Putative binding domain, N-terminal
MVATSLRLIRKPLRCEGNRTVDDVSGGSCSRRVVRNVNRRWVYGGAVGTLIVISACGKTSTSTVTGPTPAKCDISVAASGDSVAAVGAQQAFAITTTPECTWTAAAGVSWITELSPSAGQGSGEVRFRVIPNPDGRSRQGTITVNNEQLQVRQEAAQCRFQLAATNDRFDAKGGTATVSVAVPDGCTWSASSNTGWIVVNGSASGTGSGSVRFDVMPNDGTQRSGAISLGGEAVTVRQNGAIQNCSVSIDPSSVVMPAAGGSGMFDVTSAAGCTWTAASSVQWITVVDGANTNGSAAVRFRVASNPGSARAGRIGVAGATFTVNQGGGTCLYSINPTSFSTPSTGGSGTLAVSAAAGCSWSAMSNAGWIAITSGATGAGNGTVAFKVDGLSGNTRTGTITVAGLTFTVTQTQTQNRCSYAITPTDRDASAVGGVFTVSVSTSSGCRWTAKSDVKWMSISSSGSGSGGSGTGNGSVSLVVEPNTKSSRTGTATIAGETFTLKQSAPLKSASQ